jgi:hypothetical protein
MKMIATTHVENALTNVKFVLVVLRTIDPHVQLETICNRLDVIQLAHRSTTLMIAATHVSHVL